MIEPGDIQVLLPPPYIDITKITFAHKSFLEKMAEEKVSPTAQDANKNRPQW